MAKLREKPYSKPKRKKRKRLKRWKLRQLGHLGDLGELEYNLVHDWVHDLATQIYNSDQVSFSVGRCWKMLEDVGRCWSDRNPESTQSQRCATL